MSDSLDPTRGKFLVEFDLKEEVIKPLNAVVAAVKGHDARLEAHIQNHPRDLEVVLEAVAERRRKARRETLIRVAKWGGAAIGGGAIPLLLALLGKG